MASPRLEGGAYRDLGRVASAAAALAFAFVTGTSAGTTTYLQGRLTSDKGAGADMSTVTLDSGGSATTGTAAGGFFVIDGILAGTRDRLRMGGSGLELFVGASMYFGTSPILEREYLAVDASSFMAWVTALDADGTLDQTLGTVFGAVLGATGFPAAGATVSITPQGGDVFYFNDSGSPDPAATSTNATGRFLILDVPPGLVTVRATGGAAPPGIAYGRVIAGVVSGLSPAPAATVSGSATDESGTAVAGASLSWDFDPSVATMTGGDGSYSLPGIARGLDATLRGSATGYRPALTFRRSLEEIADPSAIGVGFLSEAAYASYPAAFGVVQAPSLGMIVGRALTEAGAPLAGATVVTDPDVGTVRYFSPAGVPDPALTQTSSSGRFIVLNVPTGVVVLSALGPGETMRAEVAPSEAGGVTMGDLRGVRTITISGQVEDELFQTSTVGGAVVSIAEYPFLATIADTAGSYTLPGVPANMRLTVKVARSDFKDSYSFIELTPASDLACADLEKRLDCKDLFAISALGYADIYSQAGNAANRSLGLVGASVTLSNGVGALGLQGRLSPATGSVRYLSDGLYGTTFISTIGSVQFLNARPTVAGLVLFDPRNDQAQVSLVRIAADSFSVASDIRLECDTHADGTFTNIYPCDGAVMKSSAVDAFFQWGPGSNVRWQVQFSTDPSFSTIGLTSAKHDGHKFLVDIFWQANKKKWKKIKKLGPSGSPVYWRVLAQDADKKESTTSGFVFYLP